MLGSRKSVLFAATALSMCWTIPAIAQDAVQTAEDDNSATDIIVSARRVDERLQDVPISITVLDESKLANNNITNAKDIATYSPSLVTNNRFGADNTTWTIRGFTQEQRTTATVGTFFADVVALRGSGATQGGDGAGPGLLFDLSSVQVLNGPQGTLFGRNSTGGAVLLVPKKPTDRLEGYVEASVGNYDMWRGQAVLNVPVGDNLRLRVGVDRMKRDGYQQNAGRIGFGPYGDAGGSVDYWAVRGSAIFDVTPDIENYTLFNFARSQGTGVIPKITQCYNTPICEQKAREDALGKFTVSNALPDSQSKTRQWQVINTTTWQVNDNLTLKNIFSYGEYRGITNIELFGQYQPIVPSGTETTGAQVRGFVYTHAIPGGYTNAQSSLVEELQLSGKAMDGRLTWQGGLYLEVNKPLGASGVQTATFTPCLDSTTLNCLGFQPANGSISLGRLNYQTSATTFNDKAAYFQASYEISDKVKLTGGLRYTSDTMTSIFNVVDVRLANPIVASPAAPRIFNGTTLTANTVADYVVCTNTLAFGAQGSATNPYLPLSQKNNICFQGPDAPGNARVDRVKTSAPTWLLGLDYKPFDSVLLFAKWSRGYRQGGVTPFGADKLQRYGAEKVDTYELGAKTSWRGSVPGYFNITGFYNDFRDQQLQIGLSCNPVALCPQTTTILNAGKSRLSGLEAEFGFSPFDGFNLSVSYAHLDTAILQIVDVIPQVQSLGLPFNAIRPPAIGSKLPNSIPDKAVINASYRLPLSDSVGKITIGATWVLQSAYRVVADNSATSVLFNGIPLSTVGNGILPATDYGNISVNWEGVGGLPIDASFFITNVTNRLILQHANTQETSGMVSNIFGEPRMFGFRLKYSFGGN